jgi:hypothetical protein
MDVARKPDLEDASQLHLREVIMKPNRYASVVLLLSVLTFVATRSPVDAEPGKKKARSGGQGDSHMSSKGSANTNAQWTADPERGWIRADERRDLRQQNHSATKPKENRGKHEGQHKRKGS